MPTGQNLLPVFCQLSAMWIWAVSWTSLEFSSTRGHMGCISTCLERPFGEPRHCVSCHYSAASCCSSPQETDPENSQEQRKDCAYKNLLATRSPWVLNLFLLYFYFLFVARQTGCWILQCMWVERGCFLERKEVMLCYITPVLDSSVWGGMHRLVFG